MSTPKTTPPPREEGQSYEQWLSLLSDLDLKSEINQQQSRYVFYSSTPFYGGGGQYSGSMDSSAAYRANYLYGLGLSERAGRSKKGAIFAA